jgi:hypothetical protein
MSARHLTADRLRVFRRQVPQPVNVHVDIRTFELPLTIHDVVPSKKITQELAAAGVISESDEANASTSAELRVIIRPHFVRAFAEGYVKLLVTTATLGLISTRHDQYYDAIVTYTPADGPQVSWTYRYPVTHTWGIGAMKTNENSATMTKVIPRVYTNALVDFSHDFQSTAYASEAPKKSECLQLTSFQIGVPIWSETNCNFVDTPEMAMDIVPESDRLPVKTIWR